ncbi:MAG: glutathione S-transferase family protein, partial [Gammaproteobacteria bacterium]|nr:glutathione S-transferase family protein [Gammaproteobacteria bacterium]
MYILHGAATSPFVRKTWIFLKEKGLEFEHRQLDPLDKSARFLAMNPLGRIPILEEADGNFIADSSVICDYLERIHPEPALYPTTPRDRARAMWFEEYADTALTQVCARVFWMYIIIPIRSGAPTNQAEVDAFRDEQFPAAFDYLEQMAPEKAGLIDGTFGITDISLAAPVRLLDLAGAPLDAERWPRFEAYYRRTIERLSARSIYDEELYATETFRTTGDAP